MRVRVLLLLPGIVASWLKCSTDICEEAWASTAMFLSLHTRGIHGHVAGMVVHVYVLLYTACSSQSRLRGRLNRWDMKS